MIHWLKNSARGVCMGVADLVPGVSGGTLALILGIYARFVAALSALGPGMIKAVFSREFWKRLRAALGDHNRAGNDDIGQMAQHVLFLSSLAVGIGAAIVIGVRFIPDLLENYPEQMNGLFFGLVLASIVIPFRKMRAVNTSHVATAVIFFVGTFFLVGAGENLEDRSRGTVELHFAQPVESDIVLDSTRHGGVRIRTDRYPDKEEKREIAFVPDGRSVVKQGATRHTLNIRARMRGAKGNILAGELACSPCSASVDGLPNGTRIEQDTALTGGADPSLLILFLAGVLAISAMVLPGISGSFILLMLGLYTYVTFSLRSAIYGQDPEALTVVGVFLAAVLVGLATFSRVLRVLLQKQHDLTMAALVGLMAGSLRKLWPYVETDADGSTAATFPAELTTSELATASLLVAGVALVTLLERAGRETLEDAS